MKTNLLKSWLMLVMLLLGVGTMWAETKTGSWDLTSASSDWTASLNETYFSQPYGYKKANGTLTNKSISDFSTTGITQIKVGFKCLQNGGTTSKLTIYLVDKDGNTLGSGVVVTPDNKSAASQTTYKYATFTTNLTGATGFMMKVTTFGKNILINGAEYEVTYTSGGGSTPTALSAPTNLSSSNVTTTGATLSWDAVANASSYTVKIGEQEYTGINTNSFSATGLTAGTQYTWTVKAVGDGVSYSTSAYAANANFTTEAEQGGGDKPSGDEYTHDVLTNADFTATSTTYSDFSNVSKNTAVYAGNSAKNNGIQLRSSNSNSGIVSTTSGGKIKTVTVTWNSNCTSGRTIDVYGSNTAYTSAADLYNNTKQGTKLGSIVMGTSTSVTVTGDYAYVGIRSNSGALNIDDIDFAWEEGTSSDPEKTTPSLSFAEATYNATMGDAFEAPTLTNPQVVAVTYSSSNTDVADVNASTGAITLKADGTTTITASYDGSESDTYNSNSASYTLNVTDPNKLTATFDLSSNKYNWSSTNEGNEYFDGSTFTPAVEGDITLSVSGNVRMWGSSESSLRLYGETAGKEPNVYTYGLGSVTLTAGTGYIIKKITFTGSNLTFNTSVGNYASTEWTGCSTQVTLSKGSNTPQIKTIVVEYSPATTTTIAIASACTDDEKCYSTYSNASAWVVPANLTVSEVGVNEGKLQVVNYTTGAVVPANTGVMVSANAGGDYNVTLCDETGAHPKGVSNALHPSSEAMTGDNLFYRLTMHNGTQIGFWWGAENGAAFSLAANKAYLAVPTANAKPISFWFGGEDDADAIKAVKADSNEVIYNLAGQRINKMQKGINIVNGKKVLK